MVKYKKNNNNISCVNRKLVTHIKCGRSVVAVTEVGQKVLTVWRDFQKSIRLTQNTVTQPHDGIETIAWPDPAA